MTTSRKYKTLGRHQLHDWYTIEIKDKTYRKEVLFHSTIHKNMPVKLTFCFSIEYTDARILMDRDVMTKFIEHFGISALK